MSRDRGCRCKLFCKFTLSSCYAPGCTRRQDALEFAAKANGIAIQLLSCFEEVLGLPECFFAQVKLSGFLAALTNGGLLILLLSYHAL